MNDKQKKFPRQEVIGRLLELPDLEDVRGGYSLPFPMYGMPTYPGLDVNLDPVFPKFP